jgi:hypothetical protein
LDRACKGKAADGLDFLNGEDAEVFSGEKAVAETANQQGEL